MDKIVKVNSMTPWDAKYSRISGYHGKDNDIVTVEYYRADRENSRLENVPIAASIMEAAKYIEMTKIDKPVSEPKVPAPEKDPTLKSARDKSRADVPKGRNIPSPEQRALDLWGGKNPFTDKFPYLSLYNQKQNENLPSRAKVPVGKVTGSQKELSKKKIAEAIAPSANNVWTLQTVVAASAALSQDEMTLRKIKHFINQKGLDPNSLTHDNIAELLTTVGQTPDDITELMAKIYDKPAPRLREFSQDKEMADAGIDNLEPESAQADANPVMDAELDDTAEVPEPKTGESIKQVAADLTQLTDQSRREFSQLERDQPLKVVYTRSSGSIEVKSLKVQSIVEIGNGYSIVAKDAEDQTVKFTADTANLRQHAVTKGYYYIKKSGNQ